MPIEFSCNGCDNILRVPDEHAGKRARCPTCQTLNLIIANVDEVRLGSPFAAPAKPEATGIEGPESSIGKNPYAATSVPIGRQQYEVAHRGGLILGLGLASLLTSLFCLISLVLGIVAWVLGRADLKKMDAGMMDPQGKGMTQAGMVLGIITTVLAGAVLLFYFGLFFLVVVLAAVAP